MKSPKKEARDTPGVPARLCALYILRAVLERKQSFNESLFKNFDPQLIAKLSVQDRGFAWAIAATVLKRKGQIDALLEKYLKHSLPQRARGVEFILRIGIGELLFLKNSPHAVVSTAQEVAKTEKGLTKYTGLINALLRRVSREGESLLEKEIFPILNIPEWIDDRWQQNYGSDEVQRIANAITEEAALDITVKSDPKLWAERLGGTILPTGSIRVKTSEKINDLAGYQDGEWWVQDAATALPVRLLGDIQGQRVLDLCAAPGGKTLQLVTSGAKVTAVDVSSSRLKRFYENISRVGAKVEVVNEDILKWEPDLKWPVIILDAPCSSTGTVRRHPDVFYLKSEHDISELATLQKNFLAKAIDWLEPNGTLLYCTCSLEPEEGKDLIADFLSGQRNFKAVQFDAARIGNQDQFITADGALTTLPSHWPKLGGLDGFFAQAIQKIN